MAGWLTVLLELVPASSARDAATPQAPSRVAVLAQPAAAQAVPQSCPSPEPLQPPAPYTVYVARSPASDRHLRGDWEGPDVLVVAFAALWSQSVADLMTIALDHSQVYLLADPAVTTSAELEQWLARYGFADDEVHVVWTRLNSAWVRDYGPLEALTEDHEPIWLDALYAPERAADDGVPALLAETLGVRSEALPFRIDGGALISNGLGLCAATREYFIENDLDFDDAALMEPLLQQLGCRALALVPALREDPNRHVDMLAQFLSTDTVAIASLDVNEDADDAARMEVAVTAVRAAAARLQQPLRVVRIPTPYLGRAKYRTYLNGLRLHRDFVMPSYQDVPRSVEANVHARLAAALPDTDVVTVPADTVIPLYGSLHCISLGLTLPVHMFRTTE